MLVVHPGCALRPASDLVTPGVRCLHTADLPQFRECQQPGCTDKHAPLLLQLKLDPLMSYLPLVHCPLIDQCHKSPLCGLVRPTCMQCIVQHSQR
jgi:hypothetical protein